MKQITDTNDEKENITLWDFRGSIKKPEYKTER